MAMSRVSRAIDRKGRFERDTVAAIASKAAEVLGKFPTGCCVLTAGH